MQQFTGTMPSAFRRIGNLARFLTYAWITLGLVIFARAFCIPATIIMLSEMEWVWQEALGAVAALVPLAFVGWAWGSSWISRPGHPRRGLRNLKYFALGHAACGLLLILVELVWITAFNRMLAPGLLRIGFTAVFLDAIMLLFATSVRAAPPIILFYGRGLSILSVAVPIGVITGRSRRSRLRHAAPRPWRERSPIASIGPKARITK
jgi:hypothetical protein